MRYRLAVAAGAHHRRQAPVRVAVPHEGAVGGLTLRDAAGAPVPVQGQAGPDGLEVTWIVGDLPAGGTVNYALSINAEAGARPAAAERVSVAPADDGLAIAVGGAPFTAYRFATAPGVEDLSRPFFYPVLDAAGRAVTRHFPMRQDVPAEKTDHPHHKSLYVAHGDIDGVDHWADPEGHGYIRHREFSALVSGPVWGGFVEELVWTRPDGEPQLAERRAVSIYDVDGGLRMLDVTSIYEAAYGSVTFGDTKEGGLISVRVAGTMKGSAGGRIENAYGAVGEAETWGRRAPWCDYSGPVGSEDPGDVAGIALFDHPQNLRHPTYWHVRNYGLMTANPFGLSHFKGLPRNGARPGDVTLAAGQVQVQRYRVLLHRGQAGEARVADHYHDFAHPPAVDVEPAKP